MSESVQNGVGEKSTKSLRKVYEKSTKSVRKVYDPSGIENPHGKSIFNERQSKDQVIAHLFTFRIFQNQNFSIDFGIFL